MILNAKASHLLILLLASSLLTSGFSHPTMVQADYMEIKSMTFSPIEDSYVQNTTPDTNYGTQKYLKLSNSTDVNIGEAITYLKFNLSRLVEELEKDKTENKTEKIHSATLNVSVHVFNYTWRHRGLEAYVGENAWQEDTITWNNKPPYSSMNVSHLPSDVMWEAECFTDSWYNLGKYVKLVLEKGEKILTIVITLETEYPLWKRPWEGIYVHINSREDPMEGTPNLIVQYLAKPPSRMPATPTEWVITLIALTIALPIFMIPLWAVVFGAVYFAVKKIITVIHRRKTEQKTEQKAQDN